MNRSIKIALTAAFCAAAGACSSYTMSESENTSERTVTVERSEKKVAEHRSAWHATEDRSDKIVQEINTIHPRIGYFVKTAAGYVVFPDVTKGGFGLGGAYGEGVVYQNGRMIGHATLAQGTIGPQLGGQRYTEIVFFHNESDLARFKAGDFTLAAQTSAVAASAGDSVNADYSDGVAVFTYGEEGLMFEAAVGGQKFTFYPLEDGRTVSSH